MPSTETLLLGVIALGAVVYVVGVDRTREATEKATSTVAEFTRSTAFAAAAGVGVGLQFGNDLLQAALAEPGMSLAAITGIFGSLSIGGFIDISAAQFFLIGVIAFVTVLAIFGGED